MSERLEELNQWENIGRAACAMREALCRLDGSPWPPKLARNASYVERWWPTRQGAGLLPSEWDAALAKAESESAVFVLMRDIVRYRPEIDVHPLDEDALKSLASDPAKLPVNLELIDRLGFNVERAAVKAKARLFAGLKAVPELPKLDALFRPRAEAVPPVAAEHSAASSPDTQVAVGVGMSADDAKAKAEAIVREASGKWPGRNKLASDVGCSRGLIDKVIAHSSYLTARKGEADSGKKRDPRMTELGRLINQQKSDDRRDQRLPSNLAVAGRDA